MTCDDLLETLKTSAAFDGKTIRVQSVEGYPRVVTTEDQIVMSKKGAQSIAKLEWIKALGLPQTEDYAACAAAFYGIINREHCQPEIRTTTPNIITSTSKCAKCNATQDLQVDHIIPLAKGGSNERSNLQVLCKSCNLKKAAKYKPKIESAFSGIGWKVADEARVSLEVYSNLDCPNPIQAVAYDVSKAYTSALERLEAAPRFQVTDSIREGEPSDDAEGYVYVLRFSKEISSIIHRTQSHWMPTNLYRYLVELGLKDDLKITHHYTASEKVDLEEITEAVRYTYEKCPEGGKSFVNSFVGTCLKNNRKPADDVAICNSLEEAQHYMDSARESSIITLANGQRLVSVHGSKEDTYHNSRPLAHYVYAAHLIRMHRLRKLLETKGATVYGCKTDCLFVDQEVEGVGQANPSRGQIKLPERTTFSETKAAKKFTPSGPIDPMTVDEEDWHSSLIWRLEKPWTENVQLRAAKPTTQEEQLASILGDSPENRLILAYGGRGKSHLLKEIKRQLTERGETVHAFAPMRGQAKLIGGKTFHSGLGIAVEGGHASQAATKVSAGDWLLLDELSMLGRGAITKLLEIKRRLPTVHVIGFWGKKQLPPVDGHDYLAADAIGELFDRNLCELSHNYRTQAIDFSNQIEADSIAYCKDNAKVYEERTLKGIAFTNRRCEAENLKTIQTIFTVLGSRKCPCKGACTKRCDGGCKHPTVNLKGYQHPTPMVPGFEFIVHTSSELLDSNERLTLASAGEDAFEFHTDDLETVVLSLKQVERYLYLGYWITCHRSQGFQFDFPYAIAEWQKAPVAFKEEWCYVALSRTTNPANVRVLA